MLPVEAPVPAPAPAAAALAPTVVDDVGGRVPVRPVPAIGTAHLEGGLAVGGHPDDPPTVRGKDRVGPIPVPVAAAPVAARH